MSMSNWFFIGFKKGMRGFGLNLATIVNTALLLIVYSIGVGITSIVAKIFGRHFLETRPSKNKDTYWSSLDLQTRPIEDHYRQF